MSTSEVKALLPDVRIKYNGLIHTGRISGRLNPVATVSIGYSPVLRTFLDFHFSWDAVANYFNTGRPLVAD